MNYFLVSLGFSFTYVLFAIKLMAQSLSQLSGWCTTLSSTFVGNAVVQRVLPADPPQLLFCAGLQGE